MDNILTSILVALGIFIVLSTILYFIIGSNRSSEPAPLEPTSFEESTPLKESFIPKAPTPHKEPTVTKLDSTPHLCSIGSLIFRAAFWGFILGFLYRFIVLSPLTFGN